MSKSFGITIGIIFGIIAAIGILAIPFIVGAGTYFGIVQINTICLSVGQAWLAPIIVILLIIMLVCTVVIHRIDY